MRLMKSQKMSIKKIAAILKCSPSTVSAYCRDLYDASNRIYKTEEDYRRHIRDNNKTPDAIEKKRLWNQTHKYGRHYTKTCLDCPRKIRSNATRCKDCHTKYIHAIALNKKRVEPKLEHDYSFIQRATRSRDGELHSQNINRFVLPKAGKDHIAIMRPVVKEVCSNNAPNSHYWVIDDKNHGVCKYCTKQKQFTPNTEW